MPALGCGAVTAAQLAALSGRLDVAAQVPAHGRMTALKAGDFAWLSGVTALDLDRHALRSFPAGVFDDLSALRELSIAYNQTRAADRMRTLPAGLFDGLPGLTVLRLDHNDLETLPAGIFARLVNLRTLTFAGNPGSADFVPVAVAGPAGGLQAAGGEPATLCSDAEPGGPWGRNVEHAWRQLSGPVAVLSDADAACAGIAAPAVTEPAVLEIDLTVTGRGTARTASDRLTVRVVPHVPRAAVTSLALVSAPFLDDTYRRGERVAVAVTFSREVTVTGAPELPLAVGTETRRAAYARGSGTRQLVFEYAVVRGDADADGVAVPANALSAAGGTVASADAMAVALGHGALAAQAGHKVDGSRTGPSGGICGRTAAVRAELLARVRAAKSNPALWCDAVTAADLRALTGALALGGRGMRTLAPGDFRHLDGIADVDLSGNALAGLPAGVFAGLDDTLTGLDLSDNDLVVLPARVFAGLDDTLTRLDLSDNGLVALPARVFEHLTGLAALDLAGNPGSAGFRPLARAGPGHVVAQGARVTLGVEGAADGLDDPWGGNVAWAWTHTQGTGGTLAGTATARAAFTAPAADGTHVFTLEVTGAGGAFTATDVVTVGVGAPPLPAVPRVTGVEIASVPQAMATYRAGETITVRLRMNRAVEVSGQPSIGLDVGGEERRAVYSGATGTETTALDFSYAVRPGDSDPDGVSLCTPGRPGCGRIRLNGGSIRTRRGADASLELPRLFSQADHRVDAVQRHLPPPPTGCSDELTVPSDWALAPAGLGVSESFRLLFTTSTGRDATSSDIADYNRFVREHAAAGHAAIRPYAGGFRVVGSTSTVDARDNTCTTGAGVPIYWLNGNKVADDYADFYDGGWDDEANPKSESGAGNRDNTIWTGSNHDGTAASGHALGDSSVMDGKLNDITVGPLFGGIDLRSGVVDKFYALSPVFRIVSPPSPGGVPRATRAEFVSIPLDTDIFGIEGTYRAGETITVRLYMDQEVTVTGRPSIGLDVGNEQRRAVYAGPADEATTALDFSYTVQSGDFDSDGVGECAPRPGCRLIRLEGGSIRSSFDGTDASLNILGIYFLTLTVHKVDATRLELPALPTGCSDEIPARSDWRFAPSGLSAGDKFRLLFVTSTTRDSSSSDIADYNRFVQGRAAAGYPGYRAYAGGVRVVGSTQTVDARDNTCTTGTGVPIHWLNGNKVADDYADFYDGTWDDVTQRDESGATSSQNIVFTGSNSDGTAHAFYLGRGTAGVYAARIGNLDSTSSPLSWIHRSDVASFLGLSQVFRVDVPRATAVRLVSQPVENAAFGGRGAYLAGETIRVEADFSEPVVVAGAPGLVLHIRRTDGTEGAFEAVYAGIETKLLTVRFMILAACSSTSWCPRAFRTPTASSCRRIRCA